MDRCPHDLPLAACADCRPLPREQPPRGSFAAFFGQPARPADPEYGPWVTARFDGECAGCGDEVCEGDDIRADGQDGWLGRCCGGDDEPVRAYRGQDWR
jgi:hypothetical protein